MVESIRGYDQLYDFSEYGVKVPVAPVVLRSFNMSKGVGAEEIGNQLQQPTKITFSWMTTPVKFSETRFGNPTAVGIVGPDGYSSPLILSFNGSDEQPIAIHKGRYCNEQAGVHEFQTSVDYSELLTVQKVRAENFTDTYLIFHPFMGNNIFQEGIFVFNLATNTDWHKICDLALLDRMVSGRMNVELGKRRISTSIFSGKIPFENLLGLDKPGLHQLGNMARGIAGHG